VSAGKLEGKVALVTGAGAGMGKGHIRRVREARCPRHSGRCRSGTEASAGRVGRFKTRRLDTWRMSDPRSVDRVLQKCGHRGSAR